ncbi:MAG: YncE family protein [Chitinophagaceae bacterium]
MLRYRFLPSLLFTVIVSIGFISCGSNPRTGNTTTNDNAQSNSDTLALQLQKSIQLPNVIGGFDLMAVDVKGQRLFVSAEDNHTVEVINLQTGKPLISLPEFNEPKWIVYLPQGNRIFVSTGGDGKVTELNGNTYKVVHTYSFKEACNNLRFDSSTNQLLVGVGKTFGSLGIIDVKQNKIVGEIPLSGYLKQFEIDGDSVYINLPDKNTVEVVSLSSAKPIANWAVTEAKRNVPMALDRIHQRLFVACEPGKFIIYSTKTGKSIQSLNISKDADGIYYDSKRNQIYISCGEGNIEVIKQKDADQYNLIQSAGTVKGAGTSLFSPQLDKYILAVPQSTNQIAEIRVYQPK